MKQNNTKIAPQIFATLSATTIMIAVGYHVAWPSPTLPKLFEDASVPVTVSQGSWIVSLMTVGATISPLLTAVMFNRWGRKTLLILISIPYLLSCILIGFAQNYWWYYAGRFLCGIAFGSIYMVILPYLGEISEDRIRGGIGTIVSVMSNLGYLIPYCAAPWISVPAMAAVGAMIPIAFLATFLWLPESPYYYTMKDDPRNTRKSLEWFRGTKDVDEEVESLKRTVAFDLKNKGTLTEVFTDQGNRKALIIMLGLMSAQQTTGILAITNYATIIFNEVSSDISSELAVILTGVVQLVSSILTIFVADKAGRRTLLLISMFFTTVFLIGIGVYFHLKANGNNVDGFSWFPVTAMLGYLCVYMLGAGTVPAVVLSEIFSCNIKAYATMIAMIYGSVYSTIILQLYPIVSSVCGIHIAFYGFAFGTVLFMVLIFFYLPETRGKSLGDIQLMLRARPASKFELQNMIEK